VELVLRTGPAAGAGKDPAGNEREGFLKDANFALPKADFCKQTEMRLDIGKAYAFKADGVRGCRGRYPEP